MTHDREPKPAPEQEPEPRKPRPRAVQRWLDDGGAPVEVDRRDAELLREYLSVCNAAIARHPDHPLFAFLRARGAEAYGGGCLGVAVYHDAVGTPFRQHAIRVAADGHLRLVRDASPRPLSWTVRRRDLERVVNDPEPYLDDPDELEWHWLEVQLGFAHRQLAAV